MAAAQGPGNDLGEVIEDVRRCLAETVGGEVDLIIEPGSEGAIDGDRDLVQEVLRDLVVCAHRALPPGERRRISIATRDVDVAEADGDLPRGRWVELAVRSPGVGALDAITEVVAPLLTGPLPPSRGDARLERRLRPRLDVTTVFGGCTTVRLHFPRVDGAPDGPAPRSLRPVVLLAEDDDGLREMVTLVLRDAGYPVIAARDGQSALAAAAGQEVGVLLTDVDMPRLRGDELARRLREVRPGLKVVLMSGALRPATPEAFLAKPFSRGELLTLLAALLDGA